MILLDTHTLIFDMLDPARLSAAARDALNDGQATGALAISDISLWEIAMLVAKGRVDPGSDYLGFIRDALQLRALQILPITPEIAELSVRLPLPQGDPADRLIAATTVHHGARLVTCDAHLRGAPEVPTVW